MKANLRTRFARAFAFSSLVLIGSFVQAEEPKCDQIAKDVRDAVTKDPAKVLMIVEDALVINEACACEIVKAAISAAKADNSKVREIIQTAIAVAPKMSAIITECAGVTTDTAIVASDTSEVEEVDATAGGKNPGSAGKNPKAPIVATSERDPLNASGKAEGGDSAGGGYVTSARSVFLVTQPASILNTGGGSSSSSDDDDDDGDGDDGDDQPNRANSRRTRNLVPLSPAFAMIK